MMNRCGEKKYDLTVFDGLPDYYRRKGSIGIENNLIALNPYGTSIPQSYRYKDEEKKPAKIFHNMLG